MEKEITCLCENCIGYLRLQGTKLWVGDYVESDEDEIKCDWCEDYFEPSELRECTY